MITGEYENLMRKLIEKTKTEDVKWKTTSCPSQFIVHFTGTSLTIMKGVRLHDSEKYIEVVLRNKNGIIIDYFNVIASESWWDAMNALFIGARRIACGIDNELRMIIDELKKDSAVEEHQEHNVPV